MLARKRLDPYNESTVSTGIGLPAYLYSVNLMKVVIRQVLSDGGYDVIEVTSLEAFRRF